jgi:hypothetical protein
MDPWQPVPWQPVPWQPVPQLTPFSPNTVPGTGETIFNKIGGAGVLGLMATLTALFTQGSLNVGPLNLLLYGVLAEIARRVWSWLYERITWGALLASVQRLFTDGSRTDGRDQGICNLLAR